MASASDIYPDGENLLVRIAEIQEIIVTTSKAISTPAASVDNLPFWITVIRTAISEPDVYRKSFWSFQVDMFLARSTIVVAAKNAGIINLINLDVINTVKQFSLRMNLETPTYPTAPDGFSPDSVRIQGEGYSEHTETGVAGSSYTLQFKYDVFQSIAALEAIKI